MNHNNQPWRARSGTAGVFLGLWGLALLVAGCAKRPEEGMDLSMTPGADGGRDLAEVDLRGTVMVPPQAALEIDTLFQDCQPGIGTDPLRVKGRLTVRNNGPAIGPLSAKEGLVRDKDGMKLAGFGIYELKLGTLGENGSLENQVFEKQPNTLMPANRCQTVMCNSSVRIEIPILGAGAELIAKSAFYTVNCAF